MSTHNLNDNVLYVLQVLDKDGNVLKSDFNTDTKVLTVLSDKKAEYILYEEKK